MTLQAGDLKHLVYDVFEIDGYKSKMGSDEEIITMSFNVKNHQAAQDLSNFIERGYDAVLDADYTSGEQTDGYYRVFIEIERDRSAVKNISSILDGVKKLTGIKDFRFRYYKNWKSMDANSENLESEIPLDNQSYQLKVNESNMDNYKNFFNRSYVDSIDLLENILKIKKKYADPVFFEFLDFGNREHIINNITESLNFNDFSEIIFLSKYIGDYNITKYGDKLVMENQDMALVLKRIST